MGGWGGGGFSFSTFRKRKEETHIVIVTNGKDCITYSWVVVFVFLKVLQKVLIFRKIRVKRGLHWAKGEKKKGKGRWDGGFGGGGPFFLGKEKKKLAFSLWQMEKL